MAKKTAEKLPKSSSFDDDAVALELAKGSTQAVAGRAVGITDRAVRKRLEDPAFRELVKRHRQRLTDQAFGVLAEISRSAFTELGKLVKDPDPKNRLEAIKLVAKMVIDVADQDIQARLDTLEELLKGKVRR